MRKFLTTAVAAVTFAGAVAATATPAAADSYRHHHRGSHHGDKGDIAAAAAIAGIAGLALGAALSSDGHKGRGGYSSRGDYDRGYAGGYAYDPRYDSYSGGYYGDRRAYRTCVSRERVWDPYIGRHVTIERRYSC